MSYAFAGGWENHWQPVCIGLALVFICTHGITVRGEDIPEDDLFEKTQPKNRQPLQSNRLAML